MAEPAYLRHPSIAGDTIVFVAEDDLWTVGADGGTAHRLTANPGSHSRPRLSPDGSSIAYVSRDEGVRDAYVMDSAGGSPRRLTYFGSVASIAGWSQDGTSVLVVSDHDQPFSGYTHLWEVPVDGTPPERLPVGHAWSATMLANGGMAIGRNAFDPARWKRYRGGRAGNLWIDRKGDGRFEPLVDLAGNLADPMAIGSRIWFLSDHEGVGNLYSVTPTGRNLERHTHHSDFYARFPSSDGRRIVYHAGGDLFLLDPRAAGPERIPITVPSARPHRNRRFIGPGKYVGSVDLHPEGHSLSLDVRGSIYIMPLWEGSPTRHGVGSAVRDRLGTWLGDGERIVAVTDDPGEERLVVRSTREPTDPVILEPDLGRIRSIDPAPANGSARVAVTNHRHELAIVDVDSGTAEIVHRSPYFWISGTAWSPDGRWLAFSAAASETTRDIHLHDTRSGETHRVGSGEFVDHRPTFDPKGEFLYYLSSRVFDPVADSVFHDYGFPASTVVMVAPLVEGTPVPFRLASKESRAPGNGGGGGSKPEDGEVEVSIDIEGLDARAEALPIPAGRHLRLAAAPGRVLVLSYPVRGALGTPSIGGEPPKGTLSSFDLSTDKFETVAEGVSAFGLSMDRKTMGIWGGRKLRVVPTAWKDDKSGKDAPGRESGFIDLDRVRVEVDPGEEWRQMFTEAWRLQRDYFWSEDMTGVDWLEIHERYLPLVDRVASRAEFSDLLWEMQGELGTSHAYELGGDYLPEPSYTLGSLGADVEWSRGAWRVTSIPQGDGWNPDARSPLTRSGVDVAVGDRIIAVEGRELDRTTSPREALVDRGGRTVTLTVARGRRKPRTVVVEPLKSETALRYRDWVRGNRAEVRDATDGRCGYIHIPDMGVAGFAEFHRSWRQEVRSAGLVIDVRFNRGGNVSQLLLEKLLRERLGFRVTRWREPRVFPTDAPSGPMVCLANEYAGSDGDIFAHTFKMHDLGPVIGTRTWGGVVGIWPQQSLVDGTITTQPEFGTWFNDAEFAVENYGTDPDIEVVVSPQDHGAGLDPQLQRGIAELLTLVADAEIDLPPFSDRPSTRPPSLPGR